MIEHRDSLIRGFIDLSELLTECVEYIPDHDLEFLVREMATVLEYAERHIDGDA